MEEIYEEYAVKVYKYLLVLTKNPDLAEELTAETFYRAIKTYGSFRGDCKVLTWLCQIAKYSFYEYIRKKEKLKFSEIEEEDIVQVKLNNLPENIVIDEENRLETYKAIRILKEEFKELVYLRLLTDLSFKEIGEVLNKSENWCRVNFYRSKLKIREELDKNE